MKNCVATFCLVRFIALTVLGGSVIVGCGRQGNLQQGLKALEREQFESAVLHFEKEVRANPDNAETLNLYAAALIGKGDFEDARQSLQKCLKQTPNFPSARFHLGRVEYERGQYAQAVTALKTFIESGPKGEPLAEAYALLLDSYLRLGKSSEATQTYYQLAKAGGERADVCNKLGAVQFRLNQPHAAEECFKASLRRNPRYAPANFNLALLYHYYLPDKVAAKEHYQKFISLSSSGPQRDQAKLFLAAIEKELNSTSSGPPRESTSPPASSPRRAAVSPQDSRVTAHLNQGLKLYKQGEKAEAITEFEKVIQLDPNHASAHAYLGNLYGQTAGKLSEAQAHYRRFLELKPNDSQADAIRAWLAQTSH